MAEKSLRHLGIIMDGNRRWAKAAGKPTVEGHRQGYKNLKQLLDVVKELNIEYLSVYAFSTENWDRSKEEVEGILALLRWVIKNELDVIHKKNVRVRWVGSEENVPDDVIELLHRTEEKTEDNTDGTLAICFNYGGQKEIVDAANKAAADGEITEENLAANLYQPDIPPLDLVIRTSGEQRTSNYMLWRAAYAELCFTDTLWPDFKGDELRQIVEDFYTRSRRYGA